MLLERVREGLVACLPSNGPRPELVVVGFSGGPDSLCLLHLLHRLATSPPPALTPLAVIVDHGLRDATAEIAAAGQLAGMLGVELERVTAGPAPPRGNRQDWARHQRIDALLQVANARGAGLIALGHTADDQAETVLMRVVRGTGLRGLGAMEPIRRLDDRCRIVRPLLATSRAEVERYLTAHDLEPVDDPTNRQPVYLRNRLRSEVLPLLARENPRVVDAICQLAANCRAEHAALGSWAAEVRQQISLEGGALSAPELARLPGALRARVLESAYQEAGGTSLTADHQRALARLVDRRAGTGRISPSPEWWPFDDTTA